MNSNGQIRLAQYEASSTPVTEYILGKTPAKSTMGHDIALLHCATSRLSFPRTLDPIGRRISGCQVIGSQLYNFKQTFELRQRRNHMNASPGAGGSVWPFISHVQKPQVRVSVLRLQLWRPGPWLIGMHTSIQRYNPLNHQVDDITRLSSASPGQALYSPFLRVRNLTLSVV